MLITQYSLQHNVQMAKKEMMSGIKKLRISPKIFNFGKTIDLLIGRQLSPPPLPTEGNISSLNTDDDYKQSLMKQLKDLARRQKALFTELSIIAEQKQSIQSYLAILMHKKGGVLSTTNPAS